jgi:PAS domain S-box-containing protein
MDIRKELEVKLKKLKLSALTEDQLKAIKDILSKKKPASVKTRPPAKAATDGTLDIGLLKSNAQPMMFCDAKFNIIDLNKAALKLLGFSLKGFNLLDNPIINDKGDKKIIASLKKGKIELLPTIFVDMKKYFPEAADKRIYLTGMIYPVFNAGKKANNYIVFLVDVTKSKKAEEDLIKSEEKYKQIFENIQNIYYEVDIEGKVLEVSPSIEFFSKYKRQEVIGINISSLYVDPEERTKFLEEISRNGTVRNYRLDIRDKDNTIIYTSVNAKIVRDPKGRPEKIIGAMLNISDYVEIVDDLKKSEERFREIYENTNDIIYTMDFQGNFTSVNPSAERLLGYKLDEIRHLNMTHYISPETAQVAFENIRKKLDGEETTTVYVVDFVNKDGSYTTLEINSMIRYRDNKPIDIFGIARDITLRKKQEEELNKTREKYKELFESTNDFVYTIDTEGNFTSVNPNTEKVLGYTPEEILKMNVNECITPESIRASNENFNRKLQGDTGSTIYAVDFINKDGSLTSLEVNSALRFKDGKPFEVFAIARNITERKEARRALKRSEEKYKMIFENAPLGIMTADTKGNIIEINPTLLQMLGSNSIEETKRINVMTFQPLVDAGSVKAFKQCVETGNPVIYETVYTSIWGKNLNARLYTKPLKNSKGEVTSFQVIIEDITEEKESENQLKSALVEKEILLREIHHRVKNNMQIIISLINMQMQDIGDEAMIKKYKDLQQRVRTMSIIHEDLYMSDDLSKINFGKYLNKLSNNLLHGYSQESGIEIRFDLADIFLSIDTAIPLGLIVNELLTNSLKYAFPAEWIDKNKNKKQEVHIEFYSAGEKYVLKIGDNGTGMPLNYNQEQSNTLGLMLVEILVNQLKGSMKIHKKGGLNYEIEIRKE